MKKTMMTIIAAAAMTLGMSFASFAGNWEGSHETGWRYNYGNGTYAANGWEWCDGDNNGIAECYYFNEAGLMAVPTDGSTVDASGAWTENGTVVLKNLATGEYVNYIAAAPPAETASSAPAGFSPNLADYQGRYEGVWMNDNGVGKEIYGSLEIVGNTALMTAYYDGSTYTYHVDPAGIFVPGGKSRYNGNIGWSTDSLGTVLAAAVTEDGETVMMVELGNVTMYFERK